MAEISTIRVALDAAQAEGAINQLDNKLDGMAASANKAGGALDKLGGNLDMIKGGLAAIGAGAAILFADQLVKGIADYNDLADKIGGTVEQMQALQMAADVAGTSIDTVVGASNKLQLQLKKVGEDGGGAHEALEAIGIDVDKFLKMKPADQMQLVAKQMNEYGNSTEKVAVAMALFGKSGSDMIPVLGELADEQNKNITLSKEQIWNADEYSKAQARLLTTTKQIAQNLLADAAPAFTVVTKAITETITQMFGLDKEADNLAKNTGMSGFAEGAVLVFGYVGNVADGIGRVIEGLGKSLGALAASAALAASGDFTGAKNVWSSWLDDMDKIAQRPMFLDNVRKQLDEYKKSLKEMKAEGDKPGPKYTGDAEEKAKAAREAAEKAAKEAKERQKKAQDAAEKAAKEYESMIQKMRGELDGLVGKYDPLTKKQKDYNDDLAKFDVIAGRSVAELKKMGYTHDQVAAAKARAIKQHAEQKTVLEDEIESVQRQIALFGFSREAREAEALAQGVATKMKLADQQVNDAQLKTLKDLIATRQQLAKEEAFNETQADRIQALKDEASLIGLTGKERDREASRLSVQREAEKAGIKDVTGAVNAQMTAYDDLQAKVEAYNSVMKHGALEALKAYIDEAKNVAGAASSAVTTVLGSLEDTFAKFFQTGKFGFKEFVQSINVELSKLAARQLTGLIAQGIGGMFGARADGGEITAGASYLVGERGPEVIRPTFSGVVIPNHALNAGTANTTTYAPSINLNLSVSGQGFTPDQAQALGAHVSNQVMVRVLDELRYKGMLSSRGR